MKLSILYLLGSLSTGSAFPQNISVIRDDSKSRTQSQTNQHCDCYKVSGPEPGYFQHYKLWDFRQVLIPTLKSDKDKDKTQWESDSNEPFGYNTLLFSESSFTDDWHVQTWARGSTNQAPVPLVNSEENVFFSRNPHDPAMTFLVLQAIRQKGHASTAELENSHDNIYHCSLRVRLRIMSKDSTINANTENSTPRVPRGACAGIFTYRSETCESDIEILTSDPPNMVRYTNQPNWDPATDSTIPESHTVGNLSVPWTSWVTHRLDWFENRTYWYADDGLQASKSYKVPDKPSLVALNVWSDGGPWSGDMRVGDVVYMGIEWIELAYNLSSGISSGKDSHNKNYACRRSCQLNRLH
ncbi:hypothetical protein EYZ11_007199 [Aspergillus tanneri]|uniref:GH16 domain-containing protein n=1 Tax=Aspergillus tanneri TaxID=1220188 RepID=A0A4S3JDT4_9EURO|nr:uncharacterized protein ATNIH1004_001740 [Aspergillus tanneri]KAA8652831.1 hypothetical protein ATNIH1004_001740 [Aspergillus tanneri]THC93310.1 hypothetical protein EYZ11_007199 [Aspergillus tanneri]